MIINKIGFFNIFIFMIYCFYIEYNRFFAYCFFISCHITVQANNSIIFKPTGLIFIFVFSMCYKMSFSNSVSFTLFQFGSLLFIFFMCNCYSRTSKTCNITVVRVEVPFTSLLSILLLGFFYYIAFNILNIFWDVTSILMSIF